MGRHLMAANVVLRPTSKNLQGSRLSLHSAPMSAMRDLTVIRFPGFADAASVRKCGRSFVAMQPMSPKQSFEGFNMAPTEIVFSPQRDPTTQTRDSTDILFSGFANAVFVGKCSTQFTAMQRTSQMQTF